MNFAQRMRGLSGPPRPGYRFANRPRLRGLGALGALDLGALMAPGAQYIFHFTFGLLGLRINPSDAAAAVASAGTNFGNVTAALESSGLRVQFTYNGGSNYSVGNAGNEMQDALNVYAVVGIGTRLVFAFAEGGPANAPATPAWTDPSTGISYDAAGNVISLLGQGNTPSNSIWGPLLAGLGVGGVAGGLLVAGAVYLILRD
jgi:hypothetical protein